MTKVGLLPLYIKLYDDYSKSTRPGAEVFKKNIEEKLVASGLEVITTDLCRVKEEFNAAVKKFEDEGADCIITLHLAYSPSLESEQALKNTKLPIIVLDSTPDYLFDWTINSKAISFNHGIHGVQDMCNILRRNGKKFKIFAGHYEKSDVIEKVSDAARAIHAANMLKSGVKVGLVGEKFEGMGDFLADKKDFKKLGITTVSCNGDDLEELKNSVTEEEIKAEYENDKKTCDVSAIDYDFYAKTERVGLAVRKWVEKENLNGFSMCFLTAGLMKGFDTMPFSEASKAMARGVGYGGEGDLLTSALAYALINSFGKASFVEMFCPDWQNGKIYFNHMGEFNLALMEKQHMVEKNFPYTPAFNPTTILGHMAAGKSCLVNIAPNGHGSFSMVFANGEMLQVPDDIGSFESSISGWFKPQTELREFLQNYSYAGGTHHSVMVYGASAESLASFAEAFGLEYKII